MKLLEYKAMELFGRHGITVPSNTVISSVEDLESIGSKIEYPVIVKAQVQVGGRGKIGGIQFAADLEEAKVHAKKLLGSKLKGLKVSKLLLAKKISGDSEYYLSIVLDRMSKKPLIIFSSKGGIDIEETAKSNPESILKIEINPLIGIRKYIARYIINKCSLDQDLMENLFSLLTNTYLLFCQYDCLLVEINPLVVVGSNKIIALDGKIDVDDSSLFRQKEILEFRDSLNENKLVLEARKYGFLFIPITDEGKVSIMSNGSGMIMSCIDLISKEGIAVGSVLDLGGGATSDRISQGIKIIFSDKRVKVLFINIFGGITRCDEVAGGIKNATCSIEDKVLLIRLEGTNKEEGIKMLSGIGKNVVIVDSLTSGVEELVKKRRLYEHTC